MRSRSSNGRFGSFHNNSPPHNSPSPSGLVKNKSASPESSISMHSIHEMDDSGLPEVKPEQREPMGMANNSINDRLFPYKSSSNSTSPTRYGLPPLPPVNSSPQERRSQPPAALSQMNRPPQVSQMPQMSQMNQPFKLPQTQAFQLPQLHQSFPTPQ